MSNKKTRTQQDENNSPEGTQEEILAGMNGEAENSALVEELETSLAKAQSQADEYKDGWQRAVADFQNYKRRVDAEKADTYQTAVGNIMKTYLPVMDDLERALEARPENLPWADGIELICRKLHSILEAEGLKKIVTDGQMFDPNFHEAISQEDSTEHESGQIIAVIRNGYMLGDKVIRPAMVRVAK